MTKNLSHFMDKYWTKSPKYAGVNEMRKLLEDCCRWAPKMERTCNKVVSNC